MARLQILELPEVFVGEASETPFVLVLDQVDDELAEDITRWPEDVATRIGARQVLCFPGTIDIPANDTTAYLDAARGALPADAHYEMTIGGKPVDWTRADEPRARAVDAVQERTDIASDADRLARWRIALADALGMDRLRDWDDIRNAAAGLRKERDARAAATEAVRNLHRPVEHRGQIICWECSAYDLAGLSTDNAPVAHDQCGTLRALKSDQSADA
ncbi:hypothetical protein [Streptomyces ortus]|uniref:Uncharacterized protein n=1 Tax=Streptomyces ortus TaxID=2867268 RepID=A0ABT3UWQ9_9ACTN|nr:hypothetical protein [Streptomyces ortus]MCX4232007.1 hypothetical protein [Streptomyces ortus]